MRSRSAHNLNKKMTSTIEQGEQILQKLQHHHLERTNTKRKNLQQPHKQREKEQAILKHQKKRLIMFLLK